VLAINNILVLHEVHTLPLVMIFLQFLILAFLFAQLFLLFHDLFQGVVVDGSLSQSNINVFFILDEPLLLLLQGFLLREVKVLAPFSQLPSLPQHFIAKGQRRVS